MHPHAQLVNYINRTLVKKTWSAGADFVSNAVISQLAEKVIDNVPLGNGLLKTAVDFERLPSASNRTGNALRIKIPSGGRHFLRTDLNLTDPMPDPTVDLQFSIEINADSNDPVLKVGIKTNIDWVSDTAIFLIGGPAAVATKHTILEVVERIASIVLENELESFGGFKTYRYSRNNDLVFPNITIELPDPNNFYQPGFSTDPKANGYIDILLVADGYTDQDIADFNNFAKLVADNFYSATQVEPFKNFRSSIRIWKLPITVAGPLNPVNRMIVDTPSPKKLNFSNLAGAAEVGLRSLNFFSKHPIIVFAAKSLGGRSNAQGPYVLLNKGSSNSVAAKILIHELGHTPLGKVLADEYTRSSQPVFYRGLEPKARNVATTQLVAINKWHPWNNRQAVLTHEGAYEHRKGIYRFQADCRMKTVTSGNFCPICREQLTLGMMDWGHLSAGIRGVNGMVDLEVEYLSSSPFKGVEGPVHLEGGSSFRLKALRGVPTEVRLKLLGASVPKDWEVVWNITNSAEPGNPNRTQPGEVVTFYAKLGTQVALQVRHLSSQSNILSGIHNPPETVVNLTFDREFKLTKSDLAPPTQLIQSIPLGGRLDLQIEETTGAVSYAGELWMAGSIGGFGQYDLETFIDFKLDGPGNFQRENIPGGLGSKGERRRWRTTEILPPGAYNWAARTRWIGQEWLGGRYELKGDWTSAPSRNGRSFMIGDIPFSNDPVPPKNPFNLQVMTNAGLTTRPTVVGLRASSWHPNDRRIKFSFEVKQVDERFNGRNLIETAFLKRDAADLQTVAVTGWGNLPTVVTGRFNEIFKWRVRATDDRNRMSNWVSGSNFAVFPSSGIDPETFFRIINDPRLEEFARRLGGGPGFFQPVGNPGDSLNPDRFNNPI